MPTTVEAEAHVSGVSRRRRLVRCVVTAIGAASVWLWAVEAWFRPAWCCRVPEWVWLAGGCAAAGVVAWLGARRMAISLLAGLPLARWVAVWISAFVIRADFSHAPAGDSAANGGMDFDPESQLGRWLGSGPAVRKDLTFYLGLEDNAGLPSGFDLVACSRPATRRKVISLSLRRPDAVRGFAYGGARLFACSVGADVDLGFRRDSG